MLIVLLGDRRGAAADWREIERFDRDDRALARRAGGAPQGRFNAGQKLNAIAHRRLRRPLRRLGLLLWLGERDTPLPLRRHRLHDTLTYLLVFLVSGHLYLALIHPTTRHALRGMTRGDVREDWAAMHHSKWVAERPPTAVAR